MNIQNIAKLCHESNRIYCQLIGDNSQLTWENAPEWQRTSAINGVKFHLENLNALPSHSHENWLKEKESEGWKYGPIKDIEKKEHPCFVPYNELSLEQRIKDSLFISIVHNLKELL